MLTIPFPVSPCWQYHFRFQYADNTISGFTMLTIPFPVSLCWQYHFRFHHADNTISGFTMLTIPFPVSPCWQYNFRLSPLMPRSGQEFRKYLGSSVLRDFHFIQADRGRILGRNPDKSLKNFPPCYSQSPLQLCLEIFISSNLRNL